MKRDDEARLGESLKVKVGKYKGLAGVVVDVDGEWLKLHIQGSFHGQPVDETITYNEKSLGRLHE